MKLKRLVDLDFEVFCKCYFGKTSKQMDWMEQAEADSQYMKIINYMMHLGAV